MSFLNFPPFNDKSKANKEKEQQSQSSASKSNPFLDPEKERLPYVVNTLTDSNEHIRDLQEGTIVYDERRGIWCRVKKTFFPHYLTSGPLGKGDPESRFLRKMEEHVVLPDLINKHVEKVGCRDQFMDFVRCMRADDGYLIGQGMCKPLFKKYEACKLAKFRDKQFRQEVYEQYFKDRGDYRETGLSKEEREFERYLNLKADEIELQAKSEPMEKRAKRIIRESN